MIITVPCDVGLFPPKEDLGSLLTLSCFLTFQLLVFTFLFLWYPHVLETEICTKSSGSESRDTRVCNG